MCVASSKHISDGSSPWEFRDPRGAPTCHGFHGFRGDFSWIFPTELEDSGGIHKSIMWMFQFINTMVKSINPPELLGISQKSINMKPRG